MVALSFLIDYGKDCMLSFHCTVTRAAVGEVTFVLVSRDDTEEGTTVPEFAPVPL